jgi:hypothetical protein
MKLIRHRKIHVIVENQDSLSNKKDSKKPAIESLREFIGLISAGASIFAALLYLAGRSYAAGYFEAMNIPSYQVSFSMWEYGEVAWLPLLLYPVGMIVITGFLMGGINRIFDFLSPLIQRFIVWLKAKIMVRLPALNLPESSRETKFWFSIAKRAFFFLLLVSLVVFTLQFVYGFGQINGRLHITELSAPVEISSSTPLPLDANNLSPITSSGQDFFIYKDLYLLTMNEGKYFLFKEIDQETCKPIKVYVIEGNKTLQVNLLPVKSLQDQCSKTKNLIPATIPTATQKTP